MTDDLVKRLRADDADNGMAMGLSGEAADRIEAQAAEIERLTNVVRQIAHNNWKDQSRAKHVARAALGETE